LQARRISGGSRRRRFGGGTVADPSGDAVAEAEDSDAAVQVQILEADSLRGVVLAAAATTSSSARSHS
jgi:hypothetical protein